MKKLIYLLILCMLLAMMSGCNTNSSDITGATTESTDQTEGTTETTGPIWELTLNQESVTLTSKQETCEIYTGTAPAEVVTWGSENPKVATFDKGVVTATGKGETVVWAEYEGVRVSCTVKCDIPDSELSREPVLTPPAELTVDSSFFDDAVFIGDSVTEMLYHHNIAYGDFGKAKFLTAKSYGVGNAIYDKMQMSYRGRSYQNIEDAVAATGAKKVFIMLGMNDIARGDYGYVDGCITNWGTLIDLLRSACPDITIYIQSMTPIWTGGEKGGLKNPRVDEYNAKLEVFAAENGCKFIDVAPYMKDETGGLATKFCVDKYVHLTYTGTKAWAQVLRSYTGY